MIVYTQHGDIGLVIERLPNPGFIPELAKYRCEIITTFVFTKLNWPRDCTDTNRSSSQAAICPPVDHTPGKGFTMPLLMLNVQQESCEYQFF